MPASCVIVGSSRGIGLEFVKQIAKNTAWIDKIYAAARTETDELKTVVKENPHVKFIKIDMQDESAIHTAAKEVIQDLGDRGLNYLINNAAIGARENIENIDAEKMNNILKTNVTGPTIVIKEFLPALKKAGERKEQALIVNVSSSVGSFGITDASFAFSYRISKAALNMLTHTMHFYLQDKGVNIMSVHPGYVQTDMTGKKGNFTAEESVQQLLNNVIKKPESFYDKLVNYAGEVLPW